MPEVPAIRYDIGVFCLFFSITEGGVNYSFCGDARSTGSDDSTMWLDLSKGADQYKEHLVVHEFGHSLGLGHEHQRSDFWDCVVNYIDQAAMQNDLGQRFKDWEMTTDLDVDEATEYDCESVMHYWQVVASLVYSQAHSCFSF